MMILSKKFTFHAAHRLPKHKGKCKNLHGHTYALEIFIQGEKNEKSGMVMDFDKIKKIIENKIIAKLDHSYLNKTIKNPTAENIASWIWNKLEKELKLFEIKLWETSTNCVIIINNSHS